MTQWNKEGIPHKGWNAVGVSDTEIADKHCDMCGRHDIRYLHTVHHPEYGTLDVGCVCAEKMVNDYDGKSQEKELKDKVQWLNKKWKFGSLNNQSFIYNKHKNNVVIGVDQIDNKYYWFFEKCDIIVTSENIRFKSEQEAKDILIEIVMKGEII